jgi:hypothetical protein
MNQKYTILHLSENFQDFYSVKNLLRNKPEFTVSEIDSFEKLTNTNISEITAVVSDIYFPEISGLELIRKLKEIFPEIPIFIFTASGSEEFAADAVNSGISAYIIKSEKHYGKLIPALEKAVEKYETKLKRPKSKIKRKKSEDLFRKAFENSSIGVCVVNSDGYFVNVNQSMTKMLGYSKEEFLTLLFSDITFEPDNPFGFEKFRLMKEGKIDNVSFEKRYIHKNGQFVWVNISCGTVIKSDLGEFYIITHVENITKNKTSESKLKTLSQAVEQNPTSVIITDINGNIEYVNPKFSEISGYNSNEVIGKNPRILKSGNTTIIEYREMWETITSGKNWHGEFQNKKKSGEIYIEKVLISPILNEKSEITHFLAVKEDITQQRNIEIQNVKLSKAIEYSPVSTIITNDEGKIEYVNTEFSVLTGYKPEEVIGKTPRIFNKGHLSEEEYNSMWETLRTGKIVKTEFLNRKKDKSHYWENVSISPLINNFGIISNFILIVEDISIEKKLMNDLTTAKEKAEESDRLKTAFLHNISHEIRTPMNAIVGFSDLINDKDISAEIRTQYTEIIVQSSKQLLSIITDIINIATIEAGKEKVQKGKVNINSVIKKLYDQYVLKSKEHNILFQYQIELDDKSAEIETDETKLIQILSNLVGNSFKFTQKGEIKFGYTIKKDFLEFYVKDTGIGIPDNLQEEIFQRFRQAEMTTTRQFGGSGLGLSISKSYIELLGGKIWVNSKVGTGSEFRFTIPFLPSAAKLISFEKQDFSERLQNKTHKTLLIAEDEDFNFLYLCELLSNENIEIIRTSNGQETVNRCRENKKIDLILMDIKMPIMDGYEATKQIKKFRPGLPIIAQTAFARSEDSAKAIESGCSDYISKPINRELLMTKINQQLLT